MWLRIPKMSSHYIREEEDSTSDLDWLFPMLEQSVMWRERSRQSQSWSTASKKESWMMHLFGQIPQPLTTPWIGKVDWIIGGFPCQPWSVAGKREGKEDERWLWDDIKQIAMSVQPTGFFLENVSGLITGHGIDTILGDLSEMGFDAEWGSVKSRRHRCPTQKRACIYLGSKKRNRLQIR